MNLDHVLAAVDDHLVRFDALRAGKAPPAACDASARPLSGDYLGERVRVHLNLHNGCYVVSHGGRVAGYTNAIRLADVVPRVSVPGFERCHDDQVRNVHAYLDGDLAAIGDDVRGPPANWRRLRYNCRIQTKPCFVYEDDESCFAGAAEAVGLPGGRLWVSRR